MPHLQFFLACEKALVEQGSSTTSLISVFQKITVPEPPPNIPKDTLMMQRWSAVSSWLAEPGDEGRRFEQQITLTNPEQKVVMRGLTGFAIGKRTHRVVTTLYGFPLKPAGEYRLDLSVRELGAETWNLVSSFWMLLEYKANVRTSAIVTSPSTPH